MEQIKHAFVLIPSCGRRNVAENAAQITANGCTNHLQQIKRRPDMTVFNFREIDDRNAGALRYIFLL